MKILFLIGSISILLISCGKIEWTKATCLNNPLRLYDGGYPMEMIVHYTGIWTAKNKPDYKGYNYPEMQGIISNSNYVSVVYPSNLAHIYYNGSIWNTNIYSNISFSNYIGNFGGWYTNYILGNETFVCANEKYIATLFMTNKLKVYLLSNLQLVYFNSNEIAYSYVDDMYQEPSFTSRILLGNGNSDLIAFILNRENVMLVNLSNSNETYIGQGFSVGAFSPRNQYLIYTDFGRKDDYDVWHNYIDNYRKHIGQPFIYVISNGQKISIATYTCIDTGIGFHTGNIKGTDVVSIMGVHDGFYGIDMSLTNLYIYICDPDINFAYDKHLYDGSYAPDLEGLYRIDISSLGLSE